MTEYNIADLLDLQKIINFFIVHHMDDEEDEYETTRAMEIYQKTCKITKERAC